LLLEVRGANSRAALALNKLPELPSDLAEESQQFPDAARWAREHLQFRQENRPDMLAELRRGDFGAYLRMVGAGAADRFRALVSHPKVRGLPPRELAAAHVEAEELVRDELILWPPARGPR
jgi:hypothetical protein